MSFDILKKLEWRYAPKKFDATKKVSSKKITIEIFYKEVRVNAISVNVEKGFNDVVYDLSFSKKGRKAFQKENKDVPLKKSKNNIYYLPRGKYVVKAENTETFLEVN